MKKIATAAASLVLAASAAGCAPQAQAHGHGYRCGAEDDASWQWSRCGNRHRGAGVDTHGRRVVVGLAVWCRLRAAHVHMRPLSGDAWAAKHC